MKNFLRLHSKTFVVFGVLILFFFVAFLSARHLTLTYDEDLHYKYGLQILNLDSNRFDDSKMPFSALNALTGKIAAFLPENTLRSRLEDITAGRIATMIFSIFVAYFVFRWSKSLYGFASGMVALLFYIWDPNIIAHSQLVTTDIFAAGMVMISTYVLWRFCEQRDWKHAITLAFVLGLTQLAKYTGVFLFPLFIVLLFVHDIPHWLQMIKGRDFKSFGKYLGRIALLIILFGVVSLLIINIGFLFNRTGKPLSDYKFKSENFQNLQHRITAISDLPVPVPYPYLQGLDDVMSRERSGRGYGNIYLMGELKKEGFTGYYFIAYFLKTPLAIQLAFLLALVRYFYKKKYNHFLKKELFLLGPIIFFTIYFNFFYQAQIGFRYFLVAMPFIYIFGSSLVEDWQVFNPIHKIATISLIAYLMISSLSYFPHFIPYFNEIILDRRMAYKYLADSNLDWGQADWYAQEYLDRHPGTLIELEEPAAGRILIGANDLVGITSKSETYRWLRENFKPVDTVAYSYLIFEVMPDQLEKDNNRNNP